MRRFKYPVIDVKRTGQKIKEACCWNNLSARDIQEFLGLASVQAVYRWFSGETLPALDNMYALSRLLNRPMETLLVSCEDPDPDAAQMLLVLRERAVKRLACYWKWMTARAA